MDYDSSNYSYTFLSNDWLDYDTIASISILAIIFFVLVISFGTIGNILVVVAFLMNPLLRAHSINIYMVQTSIVNLIVSALINPVYIITIFLNFDDIKTLIAVDYAILAVMHLGNTLSMYNLSAVATNRYLLIAHPKTIFQNWCVPRRRIAVVVAGLWSAAILTSLPYWAFLYYDLYVFIDSYKVYGRLEIAGYVLNSIWYVPVIIVPIMHLATLRVIRLSRMRIEVMKMERNDVVVDVDPAHQQHNGFHETIAVTDDHDDTESSRRIATGIGHAETPTVQATTRAAITDDGEHRAPTCCSRFCWTRFCWTTHGALNVQPQRNRGLATSEMRLVKMMFLMYIVLLISFVPAILSFTPIIQKGPASYLGYFGFLTPIYPATMPYIFLWSNKNFCSAAAKVILSVTRHFRGRVKPH